MLFIVWMVIDGVNRGGNSHDDLGWCDVLWTHTSFIGAEELLKILDSS